MNNLQKINSETVKYHLINLEHIVFEVTENCNLNCRYCGLADIYRGNENRGHHSLVFAKAKLLIDWLAAIWREHHSEGAVLPVTVAFYGCEGVEYYEWKQKKEIGGDIYYARS